MRESPIDVIGRIVRHRHSQLYEVMLPNGKMTLGHLSKILKHVDAELSPGDRVRLEMTPFDFDSGRIAEILPD